MERILRLRASMDENVLRLRAAIDASNRRIDAVMQAIREQISTVSPYGATGRPRRAPGDVVAAPTSGARRHRSAREEICRVA